MTAMTCRKCARQAAIHMRQHRLALCREHYLEWFIEQTERMIDICVGQKNTCNRSVARGVGARVQLRSVFDLAKQIRRCVD